MAKIWICDTVFRLCVIDVVTLKLGCMCVTNVSMMIVHHTRNTSQRSRTLTWVCVVPRGTLYQDLVCLYITGVTFTRVVSSRMVTWARRYMQQVPQLDQHLIVVNPSWLAEQLHFLQSPRLVPGMSMNEWSEYEKLASHGVRLDDRWPPVDAPDLSWLVEQRLLLKTRPCYIVISSHRDVVTGRSN